MSAKRWLNMTQRAMLKSMPDRAAAMMTLIRNDAESPEFGQRVLRGVGEAEVTVIDWLPALMFTPRSIQHTTTATFAGTVIVVAEEGICLVDPMTGAWQAAVAWECICRADVSPLPHRIEQVFAYAIVPPQVLQREGFVSSAVEAHYFYVAATDAFFEQIGSHAKERVPGGSQRVPALI
jgi:hypothetical protein